MSNRVEVRGRVINRRGMPVADALVVIVASTVPVPEIALLTDEQGGFSLRLPPGRFTLAAHCLDGAEGKAEVETKMDVAVNATDILITVG